MHLVRHWQMTLYQHHLLCVREKLTMILLAGAQTSVLQNLSYFEHLAEPMAEFVHILSEQYDYPQLAEEILR